MSPGITERLIKHKSRLFSQDICSLSLSGMFNDTVICRDYITFVVEDNVTTERM